MRLGLATRILIAGVIVAAFLLVEFALVARSFQAVRSDTHAEQRAEQAIVTATRVEKLIIDLQTSTRGYVIARDPRFLAPWHSALAQLPRETARLRALASEPWAATLEAEWRAYVDNWSRPLIRLVGTSPARARAMVAGGGGNVRVQRMRALIDPFVARMDTVAAGGRARVSRAERSGVIIGVTGISVTLLLFLLIVGYFLRAAVRPVRRIAAATARVAGGDVGVQIDERGAGEVGQLAHAFNEMSRSLARQQRSLAEQNDDLERLANVLRAVLDSTVDGILLSDAAGNVQLANRPLLEMTERIGMRYDGTVVDNLLSIEHRIADPERFRASMEALRTNPEEATFDEFEDAVSGRVFQGFTAPVRDPRGTFLGRIWTLRDVTEQRELDRLKDEFVATVSHELRTPLTSMMGFLEMIREGEAGQLTDEQKRFLAIVYRSSERLQRLVGDLLFVARLDANGLQLQFGDVRVDEVLRDALETNGALARSREIELRDEIRDVPAVRGDRERLAQLVGNLISNALKFTPAGGAVTARAFGQDGEVVFEVEDTGIGIPEVEQDRVFQRFFRSSTATEQAIPGTGLGLVISKAIAEAHGGTIRVRSAPGRGTCFRVELPLQSEEVAA